ncbi:hypothetical protein B0H66DRAFT_34780 [Apodospora peruviana]|uniref:NADH:flavin oxidoreductase/NADH oxidase N-terminal domain-containing protein n=1 Tax=Apodospora peruviana TaxID=516989 RepID=A0AAE0MFF1_9PEZI|nr:hypothetical protein B0H66DRAFT_34780 [Apodospora peruviana]
MSFHTSTPRTPAAGAPFYTPAQDPPAGTALQASSPAVPTLFSPLHLRGLTLTNRFAVSPMCMDSADDGHLTDFHLVSLGGWAMRGVALTIVEATAVLANGRIVPEDSGLWKDSQIAPLKRVVDFIHSQGQKAGIQLGHAGRKASILSSQVERHPGMQTEVATPEQGGWPENVWAPSAIPYSATYATPKEMTLEDIAEVIQAFADASARAVQAGFDTIEIHAAHGYLLSESLSPITNRRIDTYGGSFENRTRLLREVIAAVRAVIPEQMPLLVRISATEWMEWTAKESWDVPQSLRLAKMLPDLGVDLLDVSTGGNNKDQKIVIHPYYQVDIAGQIREAVRAESGGKKMLIGAVGLVTTAEMARSIVQQSDKEGVYGVRDDGTLAAAAADLEGTVEVETEHGQKTRADLVLVGRQFLRDPNFVLRTAHELGVDVQWPRQFRRGKFS